MKTISLILLSLSAISVSLPAQTAAEKAAAMKASEIRNLKIHEAKKEVMAQAVRLFVRVKESVPEGLRCECREVVLVPTNKRNLDGSYICTETASKKSRPDILILGEKPHPEGAELIPLTLYPMPKPMGMKGKALCYALKADVAAEGIVAAK